MVCFRPEVLAGMDDRRKTSFASRFGQNLSSGAFASSTSSRLNETSGEGSNLSCPGRGCPRTCTGRGARASACPGCGGCPRRRPRPSALETSQSGPSGRSYISPHRRWPAPAQSPRERRRLLVRVRQQRLEPRFSVRHAPVHRLDQLQVLTVVRRRFFVRGVNLSRQLCGPFLHGGVERGVAFPSFVAAAAASTRASFATNSSRTSGEYSCPPRGS